MMSRWAVGLGMLGVAAVVTTGSHAGGPGNGSTARFDLFERKVRPLLVAECGSCHGEKLQQGGLRLDSAAAMRRGGASGPAIASDRPSESLLLRAVRRDGELKMPPTHALKPEQVAVLDAWVRAGAPWPGETVTRPGADKPHWAFQPIRSPKVPVVRGRAWVRNPIDAFVLARLEAAGLRPSADADRRTLIRRVTYDLTGLPPTPAEVESFVLDPA